MFRHHFYKNFNDHDLWTSLKNDDRQALNEIYERYIDLLFSYGCKITGDQSLVEDCIQEVFITIWTKRERLKPTDSIKFYLFKALKRRIFRHLKKNSRHDFQHDSGENGFLAMLKFEPSSPGLDEETLQRINETLEKLTARQKEIIFLRFYAQLGFQEIASVMELSTKAAYKLFARAITRLRENF